WLAGLVVLVAYGLLQAVGWDPLAWDAPVGRVFATLGNPNFLSGLAGIGVGIATGTLLAPHRPRLERAAAAIVLPGAVAVIVLTHSFQGIPAGGVGAVVACAILRPRVNEPLRRWRQLRAALRVAAAAALAIGAVAALPFLVRYVGRGVRQGLSERSEYWSAAAGGTAVHPVFGAGMDTFGDYYFRYRPHGPSTGGLAEDPHNVPLAMATGGGLPLLAAYLTFVGS